MDLSLNSYKIFEFGSYINNFLHDNGITQHSELLIKVTKEELSKIDEDLFYRQNQDEGEFVPSNNEVKVTFKNVTIKFEAI